MLAVLSIARKDPMALEFTGPLAVAMFLSRRAIDFVWILMVIVGLAFLLPFGNNINSLDPVGIIYALAAGICWGMYIIFGQRAGAGYGTATVALGSFISTLIFFRSVFLPLALNRYLICQFYQLHLRWLFCQLPSLTRLKCLP